MDFYRHACNLVTEATALEEREQHEEAFRLYVSALEFFERALKHEVLHGFVFFLFASFERGRNGQSDAGNRETIRSGMLLPLERAERIKEAKQRNRLSASSEGDASALYDEPTMLDRLGRMLRSVAGELTSSKKPQQQQQQSKQQQPAPSIPARPSSQGEAIPAVHPQPAQPPRSTSGILGHASSVGPSTKKPRNAPAPLQAQQQKPQPQQTAYPELEGIDKAAQKKILDLAVEGGQGVKWDDIAGLNAAKRALYELVILPSLRPEFFTGLRKPPTGLLLFGPPGCGKTMLAKAVATEAKAAFFSISASALMSKYLGESEGLVKALFAVARAVAPSVVFIDEIDSLLSERSDQEHEASRRVKTEFLIQWDGIQAHGGADKRILVMGATNRPQDLDDAATRRMPKRVYIPLPDAEARKGAIVRLLHDTSHALSDRQLERVAELTEYYSQSDLRSLCSQAAMFPVREMPDIRTAPLSALRPISFADFEAALKLVRPSVDPATIARYEQYNAQFGSTGV